MVGIIVPGFRGMRPRVGPRLLEPADAVYAQDMRAMSGYAVGRNGNAALTTLGGDPRYVFRIRDENGDEYLTFPTRNIDVVPAPIVDDQFKRYYWAGEGVSPAFNTLSRIRNGDPEYALGVPPANIRPTATNQNDGTSTTIEDRFYVYTHVNIFGQEGPPSRPRFVKNAAIDDTVDLETDLVPPDPALNDTVRFYRTVPGTASTAFFFLGEATLDGSGKAQFTDNLDADDVALNDVLSSTNYYAPPTGLQGMVLMPNGFLVGFQGRDVLFSEPYLPHAWPPQYTLTVEADIVGLAVFGSSVAILTKGVPYIATGVVPEGMTLDKQGPSNACLSRRSIVPMPGAVLYAAEDGLTKIDASGQSILTLGLITRDQWLTQFDPENITAARDGDTTYVGFTGSRYGFEVDFAEPERGVIMVDAGESVRGFNADDEGRRALIIYAGGVVERFNASGELPLPFIWRSKEFLVPQAINLGAAYIEAQSTEVWPLPIDPVSIAATTPPDAPPAEDTQEASLEIRADGVVVFSGVVPTNEAFKLPSDYEAEVWQFTVTSELPIIRLLFTETERELGTI